MSKPRRRTVVIGSVAAVAAAITITAINMSSASQPGDNAGLTAVSGNTINWDNGTPPLTISDSAGVGSGGAWSPDGSRFAYVTTAGDVHTVRFKPFDAGSDIGHITDGESTPASHPTWTDDGIYNVWSEGGKLEFATSDSFSISQDVQLDPSMTYSDPDGGPGGIVFTAGSGATAEIEMITEGQLFDTAQITPTQITAGTQPSLSIDGTQVAFVKSDGTNDQIWTTDLQGGTPVQVTKDAANHSNPTWSPDGGTIAFNEGTAVMTVPADGSASPTTVAGLTGAPAYQSTNSDGIFRISGTNRVQTAVAASSVVWATAGQNDGLPANAVVLSRSDLFADALGGAALASAKDGPLLLTPPNSLNADTKAEIQRILPKGKTVYILGGTGAISTAVENAIKTLGYSTAREAGTNRFETAVAIAKATNPNPAELLVSTGNNFPDALSAGAAAAAYDFPGADPTLTKVVILTSDTTLPAATKTYLDQHKSSAAFYGVGGQAVTALENNGYTETPLSGTTRYDTSAIVAKQFFATNFVGLATGNNWPDALAGGAMMGEFGGPLVLTSPFSVQPATKSLFSLSSGSYTVAFAFGGADVVPDKVLIAPLGVGVPMSGPDGAQGPLDLSFGAAPMAKRAASIGGQAVPRPTTAHRDLGHLDAKKSSAK
jgi:putative cell wall-binding protein